MAHLEQVVGMGDHERPVRQVEDVELDRVYPRRERHLEGSQRILRRDRRGAAVADLEQRPVAANRYHGRVGR